MRTLTDREKRTIRLASAGIAAYLALFGMFHVWRIFDRKRSEYRALVAQAQEFNRKLQPYHDKTRIVSRLMESFQLNPALLSRQTVVAKASAAVQSAASGSGIQLGTIHESPARPSNSELATIQFEGTGPVPAVMALLDRVPKLGFPVIIDSVQLTPQPMGPSLVKLNLTIVVLDFDQWKPEGLPHA